VAWTTVTPAKIADNWKCLVVGKLELKGRDVGVAVVFPDAARPIDHQGHGMGRSVTHQGKFFNKGQPLMKEPYRFEVAGLPDIYLLNGVTFESDRDYGDLIEIQKMNELFNAVALSIIREPRPGERL
jgi:hypothetical protein